MICRDCDKKLQGGFSQDDGTYLCGKCTIHQVERGTTNWALQKVLDLINPVIDTPHKRINKAQLREVRGWVKACMWRDK